MEEHIFLPGKTIFSISGSIFPTSRKTYCCLENLVTSSGTTFSTIENFNCCRKLLKDTGFPVVKTDLLDCGDK